MYVKIAKGRKSKGDLLDEAIKAVKKVVGENGWFAVDRGMDSVEFVFFMKRRDFLGVVRVNKMDRDVFGTGRTIDKEFAKVPFVKAELQTYRGTVKARIKWKPGVFTDECGSQTKVLVVSAAKQHPRRRFSCFGRRPGRLARKVSTGSGPVRKYFSPNVFRDPVKIRDELSLKIRDKRGP